MKSFRERNPYAIGLVSVLLIGALVGAAFMVGVLHLLERTYSAEAVFNDAAGMRSGAFVRVAGIKAGRVTGVKADRVHGKVVIKFVVNKGVHLGRDVRAEVALETLLGTKFLRLSSNVHKPYFEDLPKSQRVVPNDRTKTPFDIFDLTKVATRGVQATDTAKLNQFIKDLADITQGKHDQVTQLLEGLSRVSAAVNDRDSQLRQLLDHFDQLSGLLAEKDQTLVNLIDQSQGVLGLVEQRRNDIASSLENANTLTGSLASILSADKSLLSGILSTLHPALDVVAKNQDHVDRALSWIGTGSLGLAKATTHGPWADIYVRAVGPDIPGVLCGVFHPQGVTCPT